MLDLSDKINMPNNLIRYLFSRPLIRIISQPAGIAPLLADSVYQSINDYLETDKKLVPNKVRKIEELFKTELTPEKKELLIEKLGTCSFFNLCFSTDRYFNEAFAPDALKEYLITLDDDPEIKEFEKRMCEQGQITLEMSWKEATQKKIDLLFQEDMELKTAQIERLSPSESIELLDDLISKGTELLDIIKKLHINHGEKAFFIKKSTLKAINKSLLMEKKANLRSGWPDALLCNTELDMVIDEDNLKYYDRFCIPNNANPLIELIERAKNDKAKASKAIGFRGGKKYSYDRDFLVWWMAEIFEFVTGKDWSSKAVPGFKEFVKLLLPNVDMDSKINSAITVKLRDGKKPIC